MDDLNAPATKGDINGATGQLRTELTGRMQQMEDRLMEGMRDIQTEMLKGFYNYAQSADLRMKDNETVTHGMRERLAVVESRLMEIEKRLNMPPAA
jgi:hypothetical protein